MEILLTGYTAFLTQEWIETAFPDDHVLTTHTKSEALLDTRVKTVTLDGKQLLAQINETYQFARIVYFSEYLLPHGEQEGELDRLRWVLQACREREVQLLYFSGPMAALTPPLRQIAAGKRGGGALLPLCQDQQNSGQGVPAALSLRRLRERHGAVCPPV